MEYKLNVREIMEADINFIADYWSNATPEYLLNMGVDLKKMPARSDFQTMLSNQIKLDYEHKKSFALIWEVDGKPVGHSNVNPVEYGNQAFMHLHIWYPEYRGKGLGEKFVELFNEVQRSNMSKACENEIVAQETIEHYKQKDGTESDYKEVNGKYIVYRNEDNKVLKSVNYSPANLPGIIKGVDTFNMYLD